ncbi:nicotinamide-nucleotide amidase [Friedmanniella endophytica]|uniref:Nicotinamide-nucleotide amidase n=1 Tax=Microlunatus kandeliicorticis TaxID=1759536 RepID=A0A7W3IUE2_9ACTN|nr:CinA family protein [Microlunatus kandeliicorticis]MBA8795438.1 nicotinamide-nucleotide amidase [Microlunatus kandeliicorticis]
MADPDPAYPAAVAVITALVQRGETVATCESLTGGLVGAAMTAVAGSSAAYRGGLVSYATDLKHTLAGVPQDLLEAQGAVAADTAAAMARGTAERCGADWGLATTGVAGPDPQEGHPPGTVFVAVVGAGAEPVVDRLALSGSRDEIRRASVQRLLERFAAVLAEAR